MVEQDYTFVFVPPIADTRQYYAVREGTGTQIHGDGTRTDSG